MKLLFKNIFINVSFICSLFRPVLIRHKHVRVGFLNGHLCYMARRRHRIAHYHPLHRILSWLLWKKLTKTEKWSKYVNYQKINNSKETKTTKQTSYIHMYVRVCLMWKNNSREHRRNEKSKADANAGGKNKSFNRKANAYFKCEMWKTKQWYIHIQHNTTLAAAVIKSISFDGSN